MSKLFKNYQRMKKFYIKKRSNFKMNKLIYNLLEQEINKI